MPLSESESKSWFIREVQVHETDLRAYLRSRFPRLPDPENLVQESLVRVHFAHLNGEVRCARAFLFTTARNLALDHFRRERVAAFEDWVEERDELSCYHDDADIPAVVAKNQELEILSQAIQALPPRCRQVITLRKIYGLALKDIAARLRMAEHTVESHVSDGMRRCTAFLARHGLP